MDFVHGMNQWISGYFYNNSKGWKEVSISEMQPGDILCYNGHVEIYAGNGRVYSCGSDEKIQDVGTSDLPESTDMHVPPITKVLRILEN